MKDKCWWHDWETIEKVTDGQIEANLKVEGTIVPALRIIQQDGRDYVKKVCAKCDTVVDTITPRIEVIRERMRNRKVRKEKAERILGERL